MEELKREEQKSENTWDLSKIYKTEEEFNADIKVAENLINSYSKYKGSILDSADHLYEILKLDTQVSRLLEKLGVYSYRKLDEDIANTNSQTLRGRVDNLYTKAGSESAFIIPDILKGNYEQIQSFINEKEELKEYQLLLERIFRLKEHTLSENEEKMICELSNVLNSSSKIASIIRNSEIPLGTIKDKDHKEVPLTNENYLMFIKDKDRNIRKQAFESLYHAYAAFKDTFTETIQGEVTKNVKIAELRKYPSAKNASLYQNRVTENVYNNLITVINENLNILYKYFQLKKDVSGLKDYCLYDTYLNLVSESNKKYSFEEAKTIILDVLKIFGEDYLSHIRKAFDERWIDIYPNKGKRGGAYSSGGYDTPAYILLNYQEDYHDLSTLIHELGHSMHTVYSSKNNLPQYASYKIFVAEVASTVNEMLLNFYMLENSNSKEEK